jgi:hypothetical protein
MKNIHLSPEDADEIRRLVTATTNRHFSLDSPRLIALLSKQSPKALFEVEGLVAPILGAIHRGGNWFWFSKSQQPEIEPAAPLLMFNHSGYIREEALEKMRELPQSALFIAALVLRMNDWVPQVRAAAEACAQRTLPNVSASAIVGALPFLLGRLESLSRWNGIPDIVVSTLSRSDCKSEFVSLLFKQNEVRASAVRTALRLGIIDKNVINLAQRAKRPEHRAVILKSLIDSEVTWVAGYGRQWVDKTYNISRRVPILARRPLNSALPIEDLIRQGAEDRNVIVNKVAANGLVKHAASVDDIARLMRVFEASESSTIKSCMEYLSRQPKS